MIVTLWSAGFLCKLNTIAFTVKCNCSCRNVLRSLRHTVFVLLLLTALSLSLTLCNINAHFFVQTLSIPLWTHLQSHKITKLLISICQVYREMRHTSPFIPLMENVCESSSLGAITAPHRWRDPRGGCFFRSSDWKEKENTVNLNGRKFTFALMVVTKVLHTGLCHMYIQIDYRQNRRRMNKMEEEV